MTDNDITVSSQPFQPGSTMKKRKTGHNNNAAAPTTFEEELKSITADMDVDAKSKLQKVLLMTFMFYLSLYI